MPTWITPARIAAAIGVLSGLAAAATALANAIPHGTSLDRALTSAAGLLLAGVTLFKWLAGQAAWEQQQAAHAHADKTLLSTGSLAVQVDGHATPEIAEAWRNARYPDPS